MPRFRLPCPAAPHGAGLLLAACGLGVGLGCAAARAQTAQSTPGTATPYIDPLTPDLQTSTGGQTPSFEQFSRKKQKTNSGLPRTFQPAQTLKPLQPPPSGAGTTGFDASNAPAEGTTATSSAYGTQAYGTGAYGSGYDANASAETNVAQSPPQKVSPYQQPIPPLAGATNALAQAPGQPPVQSIGPIRKPKKRRAHSDEPIDPYAPAGIHAGAFDIYPAIELLGGYNSNPNQVEGGAGAAVYTIAPEVKVQSDWSRHSLSAELRGSYTGFSPDSTPTLSRPYVNGKVDGRIDASRDTKINLGSHVLVSTDNPGSPNLQAGLAKLPIFVTFGGSAGVTQSFNRFELRLTGDAQRTAYQDSELTDGTTVSNKDRNYNQFGGALRGSYEILPSVKPYVQIGADTRVHDEEPDSSGYYRNSKGVTGEVGTSFELTHLLTGEVSLGYTHRTYEDPRFSPINAPIFDASLVWIPDALNTVKVAASSSIGESTIPGVSGILYNNISGQVDHAFRHWLIGSFKLGFGVDSYKGGDNRRDLRYLAGAGLTYKISREIWLNGEFQQNWVRSNVSGNDYDESLFLFGIRLQR